MLPVAHANPALHTLPVQQGWDRPPHVEPPLGTQTGTVVPAGVAHVLPAKHEPVAGHAS